MTLIVQNRLPGKRTFPLYQISVEVDEPASLTVSEGAALSMVVVEVWLSARGLNEEIRVDTILEFPNSISHKFTDFKM